MKNQTMMSKILNKKAMIAIIFAIVPLLAGFSWIQAALATVISRNSCPSEIIRLAERRIEARFGSVVARPFLTCEPHIDLGMNVKYGITHLVPFLPSVIVLGANGINVDVMAHELAHAEIGARSGVLFRNYKMPVWFDEGLAMQFDNRSDYSRQALVFMLGEPGINPPRLESLISADEFFRPGNQGRVHYAFARCVVGEWLDKNGPLQPLKLLNEISWLEGFPTNDFLPHEQICLESSNFEMGWKTKKPVITLPHDCNDGLNTPNVSFAPGKFRHRGLFKFCRVV